MANKPFYDIGLHTAEILSQTLTEASTGTPQFNLRIKVLGVPNNEGSYDPHRNQYERTIYMALTEKTMEFVVPQLQSIGFTGTRIAQLSPDDPNFVDLSGTQFDAWCGHRDDNKGGVRENWGISSGAREVAPLAPKKLRQLDTLFGKALQANRPAAAKPAPVANIHNQEITDDDIPF